MEFTSSPILALSALKLYRLKLPDKAKPELSYHFESKSILMNIKAENTPDSVPDSIGLCFKEADGTLVLHLRAVSDNGTVGSAVLRYEPEHPQYAAISLHVGAIACGEQKSVAPWPD